MFESHKYLHFMNLYASCLFDGRGGGDVTAGGIGVESVMKLQQQLHEKDLKLTDIQLEALSSAHQLEQLKETMNRMKVSFVQ